MSNLSKDEGFRIFNIPMWNFVVFGFLYTFFHYIFMMIAFYESSFNPGIISIVWFSSWANYLWNREQDPIWRKVLYCIGAFFIVLSVTKQVGMMLSILVN